MSGRRRSRHGRSLRFARLSCSWQLWPHAHDFDVVVDGQPLDPHPIVRDEIYNIAAEEALRNAFLHAHAGGATSTSAMTRCNSDPHRLHDLGGDPGGYGCWARRPRHE
jgi:hypothetical protein